ncbi:Long-chain fatty acid transport protein 6, partial [Gavia stellata]
GVCIPFSWPAGKPGLLVAQVTQDAPFSGYAGKNGSSEKKLLHNVLVKEQVYFNTGDLLVMDEDGFLYFTDWLGDTFTSIYIILKIVFNMWKGENVATVEVTEIIGMMDSVQEVNVYSVSIKNYEGRTGMAAIVLKPDQSF